MITTKILIGLYYLLSIYYIFIIINILLTWIPSLRRSRFYQISQSITNYFLGYFRGYLVIGIFDFTPIFGLLIYEEALRLLAQMIFI